MAENKHGLTSQQEANRQRDGKFGAFNHSDRDLPVLGRQLVPAGTPGGIGGNYVPAGMTVEQAYPGTLSRDGSGEGRGVSAEDQALIDSDLAAIMKDPSLGEASKARYQDMAEALSRFGAVDMAANGPRAIRFGGGSEFGGDMVPHQFRSFHAKAESDAARRQEERAAVAAAGTAAAVQVVREDPAAVKKSRFARLFGR